MASRLPDILPIEWPETSPAPSARADEGIDRAATLIRDGGLVAIPTETVYGLAADALDEEAVAKIFRAKGRPATNPLIVHVSDAAMARSLASEWPASADAITSHFWPGPVTVVVPRHPSVPDIVTAGGPTIALRCPAHRLTRRLIERTGRPLAAPSANRSESLSPTRATHVLESLGNRIDLILDGGPCTHGIESTVVDCTTTPPRILRPGPVGRESLEAVIGGTVAIGPMTSTPPAEPTRAPGAHARHYAPKTPLELAVDAPARVTELLQAGTRIGWLTRRPDDPSVHALAGSHQLIVVPMPDDPAAFAAALYATLHALDHRDLARIICDMPPATEPWHAIHDRLTRAAHVPPPPSLSE
ncbi:MAG: L-threonylcarbamoyladenylate synthase [Planctomycetia bacterium]